MFFKWDQWKSGAVIANLFQSRFRRSHPWHATEVKNALFFFYMSAIIYTFISTLASLELRMPGIIWTVHTQKNKLMKSRAFCQIWIHFCFSCSQICIPALNHEVKPDPRNILYLAQFIYNVKFAYSTLPSPPLAQPQSGDWKHPLPVIYHYAHRE